MTFAEIFLFFAVAYGIYRLLKPLRLRIEKYLHKILRDKNDPKAPVIDVTEYKKKDDPQ